MGGKLIDRNTKPLAVCLLNAVGTETLIEEVNLNILSGADGGKHQGDGHQGQGGGHGH